MAAEIVAQDEIRELAEYPGYGVDRHGNVWSKHRPYRPLADQWIRKLRPGTHQHGYLQVNLTVGKTTRHRTVHSLVLIAFVGPRPDGAVACHNNGDRADNRPENLRWDTQKNNLDDTEKHGTRCHGESHGASKLNASQVIEIRSLYAAGVSKHAIAARFGIHPNHVNRLWSGTRWRRLTA